MIRDINRVIAAGDTQEISGRGNFVFLKKSNGDLVFTVDDQSVSLGQGDAIDQIKFDKVLVSNETGADITAVIVIGTGRFSRAEVSGSVDVNPGDNVAALPDVAIAAAGTETVAANADRKELHVYNGGADPLRWGGAGGAPSGIAGGIIPPGVIAVIPTAGEVQIYNTGAASADVYLSEVLK